MNYMSRGLRKRAVTAELMDDFSVGGAELREALQQLRKLNRLFAAASPTLYGVNKLWQAAGSPKELSIIDVGAGSGDVNSSLLKWAEDQRIRLSITLVDVTEEACEEARMLYGNEARVQVKRGDLFTLPARCADIITGTQFVHHFDDEELPQAVQGMLRASRLGVVINDIHRHPLAWTAVWLASRLMSRNRYIRHDAPLSVAKGFRGSDWLRLQSKLGLTEMKVSWRPLFRYSVVISSSRPPLAIGAGKGEKDA